jgi:hypothetical protein
VRHRPPSTPSTLHGLPVRPAPSVRTPVPSRFLCASFSGPWTPFLRPERRSPSFLHRADPPRPWHSPLRASPNPNNPPGGLRTSRTPPTAKPQAEPSHGAADLANSGSASPRELCSGEPRRRPARPSYFGRQIRNQRPRLDLKPIKPEPSDRDPTALIQTYPFAWQSF